MFRHTFLVFFLGIATAPLLVGMSEEDKNMVEGLFFLEGLLAGYQSQQSTVCQELQSKIEKNRTLPAQEQLCELSTMWLAPSHVSFHTMEPRLEEEKKIVLDAMTQLVGTHQDIFFPVDILCNTRGDHTLMGWAARYGYRPLVQRVIATNHHLKDSLRTRCGSASSAQPIWWPLQQGDMALVKEMMTVTIERCSPESDDALNETILQAAVSSGDCSVVTLFLDDIAQRGRLYSHDNFRNLTADERAAKRLQEVLNWKLPYERGTYLGVAAYARSAVMVRLLLSRGAHPFVVWNQNESELHQADTVIHEAYRGTSKRYSRTERSAYVSDLIESLSTYGRLDILDYKDPQFKQTPVQLMKIAGDIKALLVVQKHRKDLVPEALHEVKDPEKKDVAADYSDSCSIS